MASQKNPGWIEIKCSERKNCWLFETGTQREVRNQNSEVRFENCSAFSVRSPQDYILSSVFCFLSSALVCEQGMVKLTFFEPRPSKTGRGEGGLLCVKN